MKIKCPFCMSCITITLDVMHDVDNIDEADEARADLKRKYGD